MGVWVYGEVARRSMDRGARGVWRVGKGMDGVGEGVCGEWARGCMERGCMENG